MLADRIVETLPNTSRAAQNLEVYRQNQNDSYRFVAESLGVLLENGNHKDVVLEVGPAQKQFQAHRNILAARSPVFAAMFEHDCVESRNSKVVIPDVEPEAFESLLAFIYTGKIVFENNEEVVELLQVADKVCVEI